MAKVVSSQDIKPPIDQTLEEVAEHASAVGKPIRVRVAPDLYDPSRPGYSSWHGLSWVLEVEDVQEGKRLREGLANFFKAFGESAEKQASVLKAVAREAVL